MKRIFAIKMLALITALLMLSLCLVACGEEDKVDGDPDSANFYVTYRGVKIQLGKDAKAATDALGEPLSFSELGDCGGLGAQVKYTYSSLAVYALVDKNDNAVIDAIELYDDSITTPEGVYIGMSEEDARAKLEGAAEKSGALTVTKGKYSLKVKLEDGKVSEINYITDSSK